MANFQSTPDVLPQVVSPLNLGLINNVLAAKQGQFDKNAAELDETLAQMKQKEDLLQRQPDKERFANHINSVLNVINRNGKMDVSSNGLTRQIKGSIKSVLNDSYIIQQMGIGIQKNNLDTELASMKNSKDEKVRAQYNTLNHAFALNQAKWDDYMAGKRDDIDNLSYHNYVDVTQTAAQKIKAFKDLKGDETIQVPFTDANGVKRIKTTTVKGLTSDEIVAYMPQILSPEESKQLIINGWGKYQGKGGLKVAQDAFQDYSGKVLANADKDIESYRIEANNKNLSKEQRDIAFRHQKAAEDRKKSFKDNLDSVDINDVASVGGFIETNSWKANFAQMAGAKTSIEYSTDSAAYDAENLTLAKNKDRREEEKHNLEMLKLQQEVGLSPSAQEKVSLSTVPTENQSETNPYASLATDFDNQNNKIVGTINNLVQSGGVDAETKKAYQIAYTNYLKSGSSEPTAAKQAFEKAGLDKIFPEQHAEIIKQTMQRNNMAAVLTKANDAIYDTFQENPDKYMQEVENTIKLAENKKQATRTWRDVAEPLIKSGLFSDEFSPESDAEKRAAEMKSFVAQHGGKEKLKAKLLDPNNKALLKDFTNRLERFETSLSPVFVKTSLLADSRQKRNDIVARNNMGVVTTAQEATVTDKGLKNRIIAAIPQKEGQVGFDADKGITYRKITYQGAPAFQIVQSGARVAGEKLVEDNRTHIVTPQDELFNVLNQQTKWDADRRGIKAGEINYSIKNENINYIDFEQKSALNRAANYIQSVTGGKVMGSGVAPSNYLTKESTEMVYKAKLGSVISSNKLEQLTSLMAKNPYDKFQVESTPMASQHGQTQFTTRVFIKKGGSPMLINEEDTNKTVMDDQLIMFTKQYPQITIGEAMLEYLAQNPSKIDSVIERLQ